MSKLQDYGLLPPKPLAEELELIAPAGKEEEDSKKAAVNLFRRQLTLYRLPQHQEEYRFASMMKKPRQWRFDFCFVAYKLAVEIDGIVVLKIGGKTFVTGGHATVTGIRDNNEKINTAIELGWSVLRFTQGEVKPRNAINTTMRCLAARGWRSSHE